MIKIDIVKKIAQELKLKDTEALVVVDSIIEGLKETICEQERLEVRNFGVFQVKARKPRIGRNPRNLKEYPIPSHRVVTFKHGKDLKRKSPKTGAASDTAAASPSGEPAPRPAKPDVN